MRVDYTQRALDAIETAPPSVRRAFFKQVQFLEGNLRHPSLRAKKYDEVRDIWQARVNDDWRFYFQILGGVVVITDLIPHPK
jgi:mRNA interferase RelE/StbE